MALYMASLKIVGKLNNFIFIKGNIVTIKILHNKYFKLKQSEQGYGSILPKFALGNRNGNTVEAISNFSSCRETLGFHFRHKVIIDAINTRILRLLIWFTTPGIVQIWKNDKVVCINEKNKKNYFEYISAKQNKSMYRALHVLNVIEEELKWRKTTIKEVDHSFNVRHSLYLITASPKWMFSPPLLSLYTLILRAGAFENISRAKSISKLATAYAKTTNKHAIGQTGDVAYLKEIAPVFKKFFVNINEIYRGRNQKVNFDRRILIRDHHPFDEGITKLVKGTTGDKLILERFLEYTHK